MENLNIEISETVKKKVTLPEYFKTTDSNFYKIVDKETNIRVQYYGEELHLIQLNLYPQVSISSNYTIYLFIDREIQEISKEEFDNALNKALAIVAKVAEI
jgi:hypothetical protein